MGEFRGGRMRPPLAVGLVRMWWLSGLSVVSVNMGLWCTSIKWVGAQADYTWTHNFPAIHTSLHPSISAVQRCFDLGARKLFQDDRGHEDSDSKVGLDFNESDLRLNMNCMSLLATIGNFMVFLSSLLLHRTCGILCLFHCALSMNSRCLSRNWRPNHLEIVWFNQV